MEPGEVRYLSNTEEEFFGILAEAGVREQDAGMAPGSAATGNEPGKQSHEKTNKV
jgi:hypothetical protein